MPDGKPDRNGLEPRNGWAVASAIIADSTTVNRASMENSRRMASTPKNTPVIGALNVAAIAPAAPQATRMRSRFSGILTHWPTLDASDEPICTIGPSRPTEPPTPMQIAEARALTTLTCGRIRPPLPGHGDHHLGHAVPARSRAKR